MPHVTCTLHDPAINLLFFLNSNCIWWPVQFMKSYIMQFSPISYYFQAQKSTDWSALFPKPLYSLSSTSQNKFQNTAIKVLCKQTYVYTTIISFWKDEGVANITKLQCAFLQNHFLSNSSSSNPYCLMPLHNTSSFPLFQNFKQCISYIMFLWREILTVSLEYIVKDET